MINAFVCQPAGSNTGIGDCSLEISKIVGFFLVNKNFVLSAANLLTDAALLAALQTAASADLKAARIYPVHGLVDIADNSTDPTVQTFGYGPSVVAADGFYDWTFPFVRGGICLLKALQRFNGSDIRVIFYDSNGLLFGWKVGETLKGIPLNQFYANPWKPNTGAAVMVTNVKINFSPRYLNQELGFYKVTDFSIDSIEGLQNVVIKQTGVQAKPVYKVKAFSGCAQVDMSLYSTELANVARWVATNAGTGAVITITSVVADANIGGWTITLDSADPDYPAVGSIKLSLAAPSVLTAAGVAGFE
ncbi:MAG: hypothetical protein EOP49_41460, partial [Sphingobacteriales bacterium]